MKYPVRPIFSMLPRYFFQALILVAFLMFLNNQGAFSQLSGYSYKKLIRIDNAQVSGTADHTNFPVLINHTDADLRTTGNGGRVENANGYDIAFTADDGITQLDHEIEHYDATTGEYVAWVRIPTLSYNVDTDIYIYYGNSSVSTDPSDTATWNSNFKAAWHLNEDVVDDVAPGATHNNSTGINNDGTQYGNVEITGKIANGQDFDGTDDRIPIGSHDLGTANAVTISAWINHNSITSTVERYFSLSGAGYIRHERNGKLRFSIDLDNVAQNIESADGLVTTGWHHVVGTWDGTTQRLYFDGSQVTSATPSGTFDNPGGATISSSGSESLAGSIDEVRLSDVARSADWIATEYNNQNDPSSFYTVSAEVAAQAPGGVYSSLQLWLKADVGVTGSLPTVSDWDDQSGQYNNTSSTGNPQLVSNVMNYYPAIEFDANRDYFTTTTSSLIGDNNSYTKIAAVILNSTGGTRNIISSDASGNHAMYFPNGSAAPNLDHNGSTIAGPAVTTGTSSIVANRYGIGGPDNFSRTDGVSTVDNTTYNFTDGGSIQVGTANSSNSLEFDGYIAETILYNKEVTDAELIRIESYLAIKYGITLSNSGGGSAGDHQASDATLLWDASVNATYHNDVAGIGRDDVAGLDHQKSISINSDAMILMDKGGSFSNDLDYILWGNDDGAVSMTTTGKHPDYNDILARKWNVAVNGTPGSVSVRIVFTNRGLVDNYVLHVDSDADFTVGAVNYPATSISGDTITFENVSFTDGDYFTMGSIQRGPGGVISNLNLWLKTNLGTYETMGDTDPTEDGDGLYTWSDQSGTHNHATEATNQPIYNAVGYNFNPSITFDGANDRLSLTPSGLPTGGTSRSYFIVSKTSTAANPVLYHGDTGGFGNMILLKANTDEISCAYYGHKFANNTTAGTSELKIASWHIGTTNTDDMTFYINNDYKAGSTVSGSPQTMNTTSTNAFIGEGSASNYFAGDISEIAVYDNDVTAADRQKIESYLAMKYSITLGVDNDGDGSTFEASNADGLAEGDYVASDATVLWDASDNTTYHNDIIAIGRDDESGLHQKQSQSQDDSLRIYINSLAADNASNAGTISSDISYVVIGHNGGRLAADFSEVPPGIYSKFLREWKVTNTNFTDSYTIEFEWEEIGAFNINDIRLLVDADGDFSDADTLGVSAGLTITEGSIIVSGIGTSHIPAGSTRYISIGSVSSATPLPIELTEFAATVRENKEVELTWQTATEISNDYFTVERSVDGDKWFQLKHVPGAGNSSAKLNYVAIDANPYRGISYYRLKQTDFDGQYSYSDIRVVNLEGLSAEEVNIYPNPCDGQVTLDGNMVELAGFRIFDVMGNDVSRNVTVTEQLHSEIVLDISGLRTGIYSIKTRNTVQKLVKR